MKAAGALACTNVLRRSPLFQQVSNEEFAALLDHAHEVSCNVGHTIYRSNDPGDSLMVVLAGRVRIGVGSAVGKQVTFELLEPGDVFGEMAVLDGLGRSADATAVEPCRLLLIDRRDFLPFVERHPGVALRLLQMLCARLRRASGLWESVACLDLPARLARLLVLLDRAHECSGSARHAGIALSQQDLGCMIGVSREAVNRHLHRWQAEGLVRVTRGLILIQNLAALSSLAGI